MLRQQIPENENILVNDVLKQVNNINKVVNN
ncbi:MAG: hypothetical protein K0S33_4072 [Bacteroidetes bacterium]|jgi:hypothetical protein|nr:hypothetical protein [Bacteroidota bacterium]